MRPPNTRYLSVPRTPNAVSDARQNRLCTSWASWGEAGFRRGRSAGIFRNEFLKMHLIAAQRGESGDGRTFKPVRITCHSRESGNPEPHGDRLDSRFRGNDGWTRPRRKTRRSSQSAPGRLRDLPVLRPEPRGDGFLDVFQGLFLVFALRNAARERWTLGDDPAVLREFKGHVKDHLLIPSCVNPSLNPPAGFFRRCPRRARPRRRRPVCRL